jgi:hypothetical protein
MTQKNKIRSILVIGILLAVFCVIAFVIPFKREAVFWISFAFAVVAFAAQLYFMKTAMDHGEGAKSRFYGFPILKVGVIWLVVQVFLSLLFIILATYVDVPVWVPVVVFVLLLAAATIGLIATEAVRDQVEHQEEVLKTRIGAMKDMIKESSLIAELCENPETKELLQDLAEKFRFSDPVSSDSTADLEEGLKNLLGSLRQAVKEGKTEEIEDLVRETASTLLERNQACKEGK